MDKKQMNTKKNGSFSIYHDLTINAPITKVFKAITEPDQLID